MSVDAIKEIDVRENKMKEEIGKYAQGLRDNIDNLTEDKIPNNLEMFSSPGTNSCISGRNFVKDKSDTLPPCSLAAAKIISNQGNPC
jgi:hypothetical protein